MYTTLSDVARWTTIVTALWLAFLLTRLIYMRLRGQVTHAPEPTTIGGVILLLTIVVARRFDEMGQPGDWYLWVALAACLLLLHGVLRVYRVPVLPPHRRDTRRGSKAG